jgi:hypothetical protein
MTRTTILAIVASLALTAAAPVLADSQLVANAGLSSSQAEGMTLTEIAQHKFNRDVSSGDRWIVSKPAVHQPSDRGPLAANAGIAPEQARWMSLTEIAAVKFNRDASADDRQTVLSHVGVIVATRSGPETGGRYAQLAASAGLTSDEARGMSLGEIAAHKFSRDDTD